MSTAAISEAPDDAPKVIRYAATTARVLLGLVFFGSGVTALLHLVPQTVDGIPERALAFGGALAATGYMFPLIKGTETLVGALLLANRFVPFALVVLAPVIVNIALFHVFLAPAGLPVAIALAMLQSFLAWTRRAAYRPLFRARA